MTLPFRISRRLVRPLLIAMAVLSPAYGQGVPPTRQITMIIPLTAGSVLDVLGRSVAESISRQSGQTVVVVNREGAGMVIGMSALAKSRPDGYTIAFSGDASIGLQPALLPSSPSQATDFEPICRTNTVDLVIAVGPKSTFNTLADLLTFARATPGRLTYATTGIAQPPHLLMEAIALESNAKFIHVPYRTVSDLIVQTLSGTVDFAVTLPSVVVANTPRGMRALAITGDSVSGVLPAVPQLRQLLSENSRVSNLTIGAFGLFAPKGLDPSMRTWLRSACRVAMQDTVVLSTFARLHLPASHADGPEFQGSIDVGVRAAIELVRKLDMKLE